MENDDLRDTISTARSIQEITQRDADISIYIENRKNHGEWVR